MKRLLYDHTLTLLANSLCAGGRLARGGGGWTGGRGTTDIFLHGMYIVLPLSGTASFAGRTLSLCQTLIYEYSYYFSYYLSIIYFFFFGCSLLFLIVSFFFLSLISNLLCYTPATIDCFFFLVLPSSALYQSP